MIIFSVLFYSILLYYRLQLTRWNPRLEFWKDRKESARRFFSRRTPMGQTLSRDSSIAAIREHSAPRVPMDIATQALRVA